MKLAGKTAVVTGGSRGQGSAIARRFAQEGARVFVCDLAEEDGHATVSAITAAGGRAVFFQLDVTDEARWGELAAALRRDADALHVLVNNAGIPLRGAALVTTARADWERVLAVNLTGPFLGTKALAPLIRDSGGGSIINTGSIAGLNGHFASAYSASKWGLRGLTKAAAMEFAPWNIRVNAIHPGIVRTAMTEGSDDFVEAMEWMTPLARSAKVEEIAAVALFLASDEAGFLTGLDLPVDGGFTDLGAYRRVFARVRERPGQKI